MITIELAKERFKFAVAHFTIFDEQRAEALHGHNYRLEVHLGFQKQKLENGLLEEFAVLKSHIDDFCESLDEKTLLPAHSAFLQIEERNQEWEARFASKRYVLPKSDVKILDLTNISLEDLSDYALSHFKSLWRDLPALQEIQIVLEESAGQRVRRIERLKS